MNKFLGEIKTKPELFLKLVKKISKPEYNMHMMEDRNGRKAMFYNYKGVEFQEGDCVKLKATIADHRINKYDNNAPLTYLNRVTILANKGTKENPKDVFGEEGIERGSSQKTWQEKLAEEDLKS